MGKRSFRWGALAVSLILAVRLAGNVWGLWKNTGRVGRIKQELEEAKKENLELAGRLEYVKSDEFVEREARERLGLGMPGEVVVIMPEEDKAQGAGPRAREEPNWRKWWRLYVGR